MTQAKFLTTREVADLLRIKERKVYELVAERAIPASRVTGKLLFPRDLIELWVQRHTSYVDGTESLVQRPAVLAGSHDPLLDWSLRESGSEIATFHDGSLDGLTRLREGKAIAAGIHVYDPDTEDWNGPAIAAALAGQPVVAIEWARRQQGLVLPAGNPDRVAGLSDLGGLTFVPRQDSAGSKLLLDHLLAEASVDPASIAFTATPARNETDVAQAVAEGRARAGFAVAAAAHSQRLHFIPLAQERFDLAIWRRDFFEPPLQRLFDFARGRSFRERAGTLAGYDVSSLGAVRYNGT